MNTTFPKTHFAAAPAPGTKTRPLVIYALLKDGSPPPFVLWNRRRS
jgi:hypothetical protein